MPTYEYRCPRGHLFEKFYPRIRTQPTAKCPTCGRQARRLISAGGSFVFKGSGFYTTDYKRSGEPRGGEKPDGEKADTKPAEQKTDAKAKKKDPGGK